MSRSSNAHQWTQMLQYMCAQANLVLCIEKLPMPSRPLTALGECDNSNASLCAACCRGILTPMCAAADSVHR